MTNALADVRHRVYAALCSTRGATLRLPDEPELEYRDVVCTDAGSWSSLFEDGEGEVRGNTVRLHSRDEVSDGTLAHGAELVGAMARIPYIFLAVVSLGFIAALVASADSRRREFAAMRAVGATRLQVAGVLVAEALRTALGGVALGTAGGALVGWLCTAGTRAAMANWGLPACFAMPPATIALGALGAVAFSLAVAIPAALANGRRF